MRKITAAAILFACLMLGMGTVAQADSMTSLTITGYNLTQGVNVTLNNVNLGTKYGAEFFGRVNLGNNNFEDVVGYCIDLYDTVGTGTYTSYGLSPVTSSGSTQQAAWLLGHYDPSLGNPYSPNSLSTTITALQVAIWEVTFDYSSSGIYNLTSGSFKTSGLSTAVANLANSYLTALSAANLGANGLDFSGVVRSGTNLASDGRTLTGGSQDLIVGNTPEPGSMVLFGSAAGLMGWLRRRRAQARKVQEPAAEAGC
jgi:hypothetical protein